MGLQLFRKYYGCASICLIIFYEFEKDSPGYKFMLSNPKNKGAMKRMNMFLRWMVRKNSPVDIGIWDFIGPDKLFNSPGCACWEYFTRFRTS